MDNSEEPPRLRGSGDQPQETVSIPMEVTFVLEARSREQALERAFEALRTLQDRREALGLSQVIAAYEREPGRFEYLLWDGRRDQDS